MVRIFLVLSVFAIVLLAATLLLGLSSGDFGESVSRYSNAVAADAVAAQSHMAGLDSATKPDRVRANAEREEALQKLRTMQERFRPHKWLGIAAALVTVLVNCISVTYFVGTSRWCREVVEAYGLDPELAERSRRLKRRSFPFAFLGLMTTLAIVALGGAADPGGNFATAARWVIPHFIAAMLGIVVIAIAFFIQANAVGANYQVIQRIVAEAQ